MTVEQEVTSEFLPSRPRPALPEATAARLSQHPPGLVAVLTKEVGSYKDFIFCFRALLTPAGSGDLPVSGGEKVDARNAAVRALLARPELQWLYQLDDDHYFAPTILLDQLDVMAQGPYDILGVLYVGRVAPPSYPIGGIAVAREEGPPVLRRLAWSDLPRFSPVLERPDLCLGTAGLLVRRHVFEKLDPPWFRVGQLDPGREWEDLEFSVRAQAAGFRLGLWCGPTTGGIVGIGHVARCTLHPTRDGHGGWGVGVSMDQPVTAGE